MQLGSDSALISRRYSALAAYFLQAEITNRQLRRFARKRNLAVRVRQNSPTGKSLLIFRNNVNRPN
jgi:hypothetical protein